MEKRSNLKESALLKKRITELEKLFTQEIQKVADLLKENQALNAELEKLKHNCDTWRKYYERTKKTKDRKIPCNRSRAMVIHGELTLGDIMGR